MERQRVLGGFGLHPLKWSRRFVTRAGRRLGYFITQDLPGTVYREHLLRLFSARRINCVLDVGAHQGDFGNWLRTIGYLGLIVSFEPVAENFEVLKQRSDADGRWHAHQLALGASSGKAEIRVFSGNTFHSFLPPSDYGLDRFPTKMQVERTEVVAVARLGELLDGAVEGLEQPHIFLKVDTQGYDLEVIRGLGTSVERITAVQVEMSTRSFYENPTNSFVEAISELQDLGFDLSGIFPINYDSDGLTLVELDCLMCRSPTHPDMTGPTA